MRERIQQDRVDDAEHSRVRADAKRHDRHANERKAGTSSSRANGIGHIVPDVVDPDERSSITVLILGVLDAAERSPRSEHRFFGCHAAAAEVVFNQAQVRINLPREVRL